MTFLKKESNINALDIGTSAVRIVVAKQKPEGKLQILGVGQSACNNGLRRGIVVDIEETIQAIISAKEAAERAAGMPIESAYVSLEGNHILAHPSKGTVAISRADGEVSEEDVKRAIEAAQAISLPLNRQLLDIIPRTFSIDSQNNIKYPVGMNGVRLEVDALLLEAATPIMKNLTKCINQAGIDINKLIPAPLAASYAVLAKRQKELGVALIDIGAGTTGLIIFEEGEVLHTVILPIGSSHVTNDIAIGLQTSIDVAEKVKLDYYKKDKIDLSKISEDEDGTVLKEKIKSIIEPRLAEIFSMINKEFRAINRQKLLPAGVVLVGGGARMPNIVEIAKKYLELPVQIGCPSGLEGITDQVIDPSFAVAVGLIAYGLGDDSAVQKNYLPLINSAGNKIKNWLRAFLP